MPIYRRSGIGKLLNFSSLPHMYIQTYGEVTQPPHMFDMQMGQSDPSWITRPKFIFNISHAHILMKVLTFIPLMEAIIYILKVLICCLICYYYYKSVLCSFLYFIVYIYSFYDYFHYFHTLIKLYSRDQLSIDLLILPILHYLMATDLRTV